MSYLVQQRRRRASPRLPSPTPDGGRPGCDRAMSGSNSRYPKSEAVPALRAIIAISGIRLERPRAVTPPGVNGSIVYVRHVGAKQALYTVQPDGAGLREINADSWGDPDWSPEPIDRRDA